MAETVPLEAVWAILDYLSDEEGDYEEAGRPSNHIYRSMRDVRRWLKEVQKTRGDLTPYSEAIKAIAQSKLANWADARRRTCFHWWATEMAGTLEDIDLALKELGVNIGEENGNYWAFLPMELGEADRRSVTCPCGCRYSACLPPGMAALGPQPGEKK
jgi:hypothetical protein